MNDLSFEDFLETFRELFSIKIKESITKDTVYTDIDEWSSLQSIIVFTTINEKYNISFTQKEYNATNTVEELFLLVKEKCEN